MTWVVLPGLALVPSDYAPLATALGADGTPVHVVDSWRVPVTGPVDDVRDAVGASGPVRLVGHSVGGLAALEWTLRHPGEVDRLVLLDPTSPYDADPTLLHPGRAGARVAERLVEMGARVAAGSGPRLRSLTLRGGGVTSDTLDGDEARRRLGTPEAWRFLASEWSASWAQVPRVRRMLDDGATVPATARPVHVVGLRHAGRAFLRSQGELASRVGSHRLAVADAGHLFPLVHPRTVARIALADR